VCEIVIKTRLPNFDFIFS